MARSKEVAEQIEAAFDFRGHVTVALNDGSSVEGFLFNREAIPLKGEPYIEVLRKDSEERLRIASKDVKSIALTGKDFAVPFVPPKKD
jgi:hypothetical protein